MDFSSTLNILRLLFGRGFIMTLRIISLALLFAGIFGVVGGIIRVMKIAILDRLIGIYIAIIRGTPLLVFLFIMFYGLSIIDDPYIAAVLGLTFYHGAYMIEIVRAGIESVSEGQRKAARSLGMSFYQQIRFIILPQALLVMLPGAIGQLIILIKDTSIVSVLGITEITKLGTDLVQVIPAPFQIFTLVAVSYYILCHSLKKIADQVEKRVRRIIFEPSKTLIRS